MIQLHLKVAVFPEHGDSRNLTAAFGIGRILLFSLFLLHSYKDSNADGDYVLPVFSLPLLFFLSGCLHVLQQMNPHHQQVSK